MTENTMGDIVGLCEPDRVVGLLKVKSFVGITMHIDPKYLQSAFTFLNSLNKEACDVQIGISNSTPGGGFYIFLDEEREIAIGVAGRMGQTKESDNE